MKSQEIGGKTYWFREITAGERLALLKGQKITRQGSATSFDLDLGQNEEQRQKLVLFSTCNENGTAYFADLKALQKESAKLINKLYVHADAANAEEDDPGNG